MPVESLQATSQSKPLWGNMSLQDSSDLPLRLGGLLHLA